MSARLGIYRGRGCCMCTVLARCDGFPRDLVQPCRLLTTASFVPVPMASMRRGAVRVQQGISRASRGSSHVSTAIASEISTRNGPAKVSARLALQTPRDTSQTCRRRIGARVNAKPVRTKRRGQCPFPSHDLSVPQVISSLRPMLARCDAHFSLLALHCEARPTWFLCGSQECQPCTSQPVLVLDSLPHLRCAPDASRRSLTLIVRDTVPLVPSRPSIPMF